MPTKVLVNKNATSTTVENVGDCTGAKHLLNCIKSEAKLQNLELDLVNGDQKVVNSAISLVFKHFMDYLKKDAQL